MSSLVKKFAVADIKSFKRKMLNWAQQFNIFCFTDNCGYGSPLGFKTLLACGVESEFELAPSESFDRLQQFIKSCPGWLFGHINYEAGQKKMVNLPDRIGFPDAFLFSPRYLISYNNEGCVEFLICPFSPEKVFEEINNFPEAIVSEIDISEIQSVFSKEEYLDTLNKIKEHIQQGDCYEINFCQEFFANGIIDPLQYYFSLSEISPNPFSAFYKFNDKFSLCSSPERFIKKSGLEIISQPIKGTIARGRNEEEDNNNLLSLKNSEKDKSENVMIVDLVRNDFSKVCLPGSVKVSELFAIRSFPGVHQMVSTINGELKKDTNFSEILEATFPMGSMTGAPKIKVMSLIDHFERSKRGLFSGSIGYIEPNGDFDFNVVIRTLFYNSTQRNISFQAGGGITNRSIAEDEYAESLLKTGSVRKALKNKLP